jgi:MFS superfamily sulfate permease-like transporter
MAYAELAGLPAITGLYTTVVCLVAYRSVAEGVQAYRRRGAGRP